MLNPQKLEKFVQQIHDALPNSIKELGSDVENKIKQVIQAQLNKLDVVTREDFEIQTQVLIRTREKLTTLEKKIDELMLHLDYHKNKPTSDNAEITSADKTE